ncbi:hypothetical protein LU631_00860 [Erwinia tracheiphila]|uniref:Type III secretion system protein n=1 Tax=Erwinia tracheiphila TaxID=65700 RepID=A0A0M2KI78_9GAMM|nr:hypothetical protein [Erwinia tracheiphila]AXF77652.1 hypothetical protein AV903_18935 [Erwinia tracheiphila]EOS94430.1 type III secretion system protein [Erwinia tracheiphila PSU-1]KKF36726.1 hypothetical protein SY86_16930 [Erwinia tracheiphila]UIA83660.1 hypothetical protein LU604_00415 [Erwinia tracheiphila]UIA88060.1 hypothetical protein LU631_00860 [Erwinia tracheiphila]
MTKIINDSNSLPINNTDNLRAEDNYHSDLLDFIRENKPSGTSEYDASNLSEFLQIIKDRYKLSDAHAAPTLSQLSNTLLYVNSELRKEINTNTPEDINLQDYVYNHLNRYTTQLIGVNMFYDSMIKKILDPDENEKMELY